MSVPPMTKRSYDAVICVFKSKKRRIIPFSQRKLKRSKHPRPL